MEKKKYNITVGNETKEFEEGTTYQAVAKEFCGSFSHPAVLAVEGENRLQELRKTVEKNCELKFITTADAIGHETYKRSLCFLLVKAVHDVAGHDKIERVRIHFSVDKGYYCTVDGDIKITEQFLADVHRIYEEKNNVLIAVSEGIHYADGSFVSEAKASATDGFGHAQLGGLAATMSLWETDAFAAVFSLCGSFWYPGVADFIEEHVPKNYSAQVYLQNGIREGKGHNNRLCGAYSYAQRVHTALQATCGAKTVLDDYGHHDRQSERLNAALRWVERVL